MTRSLINRLDDIANLTGILQLSEKLAKQQQRRRHLRWWPIFALVLATIGTATFLTSSHFALGIGILGLAQIVAGFLPLFGPVKPWGALEGVDERDRKLRRDAFLFCLSFISIGMFFTLPVLAGVAELYQFTSHHLIRIIFSIWYVMVILFATLPTLYASWSTEPLDEE